MKTQLKTEVKGISLEFDIREAKEFLRDPSRLQNEVRMMLKHGGVDVPENKKYECEFCGKKCNSERGLNMHKKRMGCGDDTQA